MKRGAVLLALLVGLAAFSCDRPAWATVIPGCKWDNTEKVWQCQLPTTMTTVAPTTTSTTTEAPSPSTTEAPAVEDPTTTTTTASPSPADPDTAVARAPIPVTANPAFTG